jgi:hypothetical protein
MKRRGLTLVELLATLPLIAAAGLVFSWLFVPLVLDVPRLQKAVSQERSVQDLLKHIQADIDAAVELPDKAHDLTAGKHILIIRTAEGAVSYKVENGVVMRMSLGKSDKTDGESWKIPGLVLRFQSLSRNGNVYAVDVYTAIKINIDQKSEEFLSNRHVFFLNTLPPSVHSIIDPSEISS